MKKNQENTNGKITFTFSKEERLCSKKVIDKLFAEGKSFLAFPIKVVFLKLDVPAKSKVQAAFTVGKRNFKRAVHRNRIKRLMREAYRLNKHELYAFLEENQLAVFFIFIGKEIPEYKQVDKAMKKAIKSLQMRTNKLKADEPKQD